MKLKFDDLDLESDFPRCEQLRTNEKVYVQIRDGQDPESKELAVYCGYQTFFSSFPEVYSTGRYMWIKFYSNSPLTWRKKGFKARFEAVDLRKYYPLTLIYFSLDGG